MFDAKSILESLVTGGKRGTATASGQQSDPLSDLLGESGLGDLLRNGPASNEINASGGQQGDPLRDLLGKLGFDKGATSSSGGQPSDSPSSGGSSTGRNITDVLGDLFKQATEGTKEGAQRIDDATGTSSKIEDLSRQLAGKSPQELIDSLKDLISQNKLGTGAALGGLGALILGTQTGRSAAATAAKLGALALIGGLAYKAYKNYQDGQQADAAATGDILAPPSGSGFEPEAVSNDDAVLMVRTMIAAAAADGRIDSNEQKRILSNLQNDGELEPGAEEFLARELNAPASAEDIAAAVHSKEQAAQVYAAARIAVDPDTRGEQAFLYDLARRLDIERDLAQHINAAARNA